jgi:hypothetical protein
MCRKRAMSLIRVYLLAETFVFRNEHFQLVFKLKTTLLKIRAQRRRYQHDLVEIRWGGGFQILGLRRGRDQLVLMPKERP